MNKTEFDSFWRDREVGVTGGTGFLGYLLVKKLITLGAKVTVYSLEPRKNHPIHSLNTHQSKLIWGDIRDSDAVEKALHGKSVIFHTAGLVAVWGKAIRIMEEVHRDGTRNVLKALSPSSVLVHTSSIVAVGATRDGKILQEQSEFTLPKNYLPYIQAKKDSEELVLSNSSENRMVVVNPGYLIGPEDEELSIMGRFCLRFWRGRIPIAVSGGLNYVDVRDVVDGHLAAAILGKTRERYILGGYNLNYVEFQKCLSSVAHYRPRAMPKIPWIMLRIFAELAEMRSLWTKKEPYPAVGHARLNRYYWYVNSEKATRELNYQPRPLQETLEEMYQWFVKKYPIHVRGLNRWWFRPSSVPPFNSQGIDSGNLGTFVNKNEQITDSLSAERVA